MLLHTNPHSHTHTKLFFIGIMRGRSEASERSIDQANWDMTTTTFLYLSYIYEEPDWGAQDVLSLCLFFVCVCARARVLSRRKKGSPFYFPLQIFRSVHIWAGRSLMIPLGYHAAYVDTYIKRIES